uniref:Apple domain-containing protein n=1 Tax=Plectus sambesii TaxID=2011161 RepID=A0A914WKK4_9BILA
MSSISRLRLGLVENCWSHERLDCYYPTLFAKVTPRMSLASYYYTLYRAQFWNIVRDRSLAPSRTNRKMLGGLAEYHRKRASDVGDMPAVGEGQPPLYEFFNDDDAPPVPRRPSVTHGMIHETLDAQHLHPKQMPDHHVQVVPAATTLVPAKGDAPATLDNKRTSIHHISPPTTAKANQSRRSTISAAPIKKGTSLAQRCCQVLVIFIIIAILLIVGGMLLESKVLHLFERCDSSAHGQQTTSSGSEPMRDRVEPSPFCPFGSAMLSTTTGNQSTHTKALQMVVADEYACRNECESIPSCERAVFVGDEGNKCYLELTDAVDSNGRHITCLKSRNQSRSCPNNLLCKAWIKMCLCPQLDQDIDYATTKTLLDDVAFALQCTSIDLNGEQYVLNSCVPVNEG